MRIKNVEKFRKELYEAIKDGNCYNYCECSSAVVRKGHLDWVEEHGGVKDYNLYREFGDGRYRVVSLADPIHFTGTGIYMTVDDKGVDFWENNKVTEEDGDTFFVHKSWVDFEYYQNKMGFVVAVVNKINELTSDAKRKMEA